MPVFEEQYANFAATTLSGSITSGSTTLFVEDTSKFPPVPQFRVNSQNELLLVTAITGKQWTVTRGVEGTPVEAIASGTAITHVVTVSGLTGVCGKTNLYGPYSTLPPAGVVGRVFQPTSGHVYLRDNGAAWQGFGPIFPITIPPTAGNWAPVNLSTSATGDIGNTVWLEIPATASDNLRGMVRTLPSATGYTITALFSPYWGGETFARIGIGLYDGTKIVTLWWDSANSTTTMFFVVQEWTNATTFAGQPSNNATYYSNDRNVWGQDMQTWFRIRDDGTTLYFEVSKDYQKWYVVSTLGNTAFLTATKVGIFLNGFNATKKNALSLLSWSEA